MAKPKPHIYHVPKDHHIAAKMKKGGKMKVTMSRMGDEPNETGSYEMQEEMAEPDEGPTPGAPTVPPKSKAKKHIDYLKEKRRVVT